MSAKAALTEREREILAMIGRGDTTQRISEALDIAVSTVRKHRENLMRKLDLHSTAEVMLYSLTRGRVGSAAIRPAARRAKPRSRA